MTLSILGLSSLFAVAAPPVDPSMPWTAEIEPGAPISAATPWAIAPADHPRTLHEELFGKKVDITATAPLEDGRLLFDGESLARDVLAQQGLPLPGLDHDPTPGVLFLAMDGLTLKPTCGGGQQANGALNCSPLVKKQTTFPKVTGGENTKAVVVQELGNFFGAYNLVITTNRPPDYLPYTMAVIGGTSGNAGQQNGVCGIANVACDGAKRNHVSLTFPDSCIGTTAEIAAQETAHNWGLEHTDVQADLMYPFVAGGNSFRDECMPISHATGSGVTQCTYVHELYCPAGKGEQQNSHTELLGVFGPREEDKIAPEILSMSPADGSQIPFGEPIQITAKVTDNSNMLGVKWTWIDGLPPDFQDSGYTRCTNQVCTDDFGPWRPISDPWDFINLDGAPPGNYSFKLEVMDAYGNSDTQMIAFTVLPNPSDPTTGTTGDPPTTTDPTGEPDPTGGPDPGTTGDDTAGVTGVTGASGATGATGLTGDDPDGGDDSCNCRTDGRPLPLALLLLAGLRRRSRRT